jgi:chromosome segregation ATPase
MTDVLGERVNANWDTLESTVRALREDLRILVDSPEPARSYEAEFLAQIRANALLTERFRKSECDRKFWWDRCVERDAQIAKYQNVADALRDDGTSELARENDQLKARVAELEGRVKELEIERRSLASARIEAHAARAELATANEDAQIFQALADDYKCKYEDTQAELAQAHASLKHWQDKDAQERLQVPFGGDLTPKPDRPKPGAPGMRRSK